MSYTRGWTRGSSLIEIVQHESFITHFPFFFSLSYFISFLHHLDDLIGPDPFHEDFVTAIKNEDLRVVCTS